MKESATGVIGVIGATGFIGGRLCTRLEEEGRAVVRFSRTPRSGAGWRPVPDDGEPDVSGLSAVVNLAGESIAQRWTAGTWRRIVDSRVRLTGRVVRALERLPDDERPGVLVNGSAIGYYPSAGDRELREDDAPGSGRLEDLCVDWEKAAAEAGALGVREVRLRTGIVLGHGGEAWERMARVFRFGLGGKLGDGEQWMPWIHIEDVVGAILHTLADHNCSGPVNLTAPHPVRNDEFTRCLAAQLGRPAVFRVPGAALRLGLGGFGETLLASYRVIPQRLLEAGFRFRFARLEEALADLAG